MDQFALNVLDLVGAVNEVEIPGIADDDLNVRPHILALPRAWIVFGHFKRDEVGVLQRRVRFQPKRRQCDTRSDHG